MPYLTLSKSNVDGSCINETQFEFLLKDKKQLEILVLYIIQYTTQCKHMKNSLKEMIDENLCDVIIVEVDMIDFQHREEIGRLHAFPCVQIHREGEFKESYIGSNPSQLFTQIQTPNFYNNTQ